MQKLSINNNHFENKYTLAGTHFEHRILESLGIPMELDKQIILEDLRLRVNLDGNTNACIYECKTHQAEKEFKLPRKYINQVQVQMFASGIHQAKVIAYGLDEKDYDNFFRPIDPRRLKEFPIEYDPAWIQEKYLPKLRVLVDCLKRGVLPNEAII
jgi:ribosomal protein L1